MKVIFSHGKESGPWGRKIKVLADVARKRGLEVESLNYTNTLDPDERVKTLSAYLENEQAQCILVGSSMGGYVSVINAMRHKVVGLFLLAPALYMPNYNEQEYTADCPTEIVHGWNDDVIPFSHSIRFAEQAKATLHLINGDHSLTEALPLLNKWFEHFLDQLTS